MHAIIKNAFPLKPSSIFNLLLISFVFTILVFNIYLLYFAVDFLDGAFYLAVPYHYMFGAKPFIDEYMIMAEFGVLTYPLVKVYHYLYGVEGIFLSFRYLYLFFSCITSLIVFSSLKDILNKPFAILIALFPVVYIPFNISLFGYNTIAMHGFIISFFLLFKISNFKGSLTTKSTMAFFSGLSAAISIIAYPTLVFILPIYFTISYIFLKQQKKIILYSLLGVIVGLSWFLENIYNVSIEHFIYIYKWMGTINYSLDSTDKLSSVITTSWNLFHFKYLIAFLSIGIFLLNRVNLFPTSVLKCYGSLAMLFLVSDSWIFTYIRNVGFLAPFLLLMNSSEQISKKMFWMIWIPGFATGLLTSYSSSTGVLSNYVGGLSCALVSLSYIGILFQNLSFPRAPVIIILISGLLFCEYHHLQTQYCDTKLQYLEFKIPDGPYKGIYTTQENRQFLINFQRDLKDLEGIVGNKKRILFFDDFPLGYLLGNFIPHTNAVWLFQKFWAREFDKQATIDYYEKNGYPDIIVYLINPIDFPGYSNVLLSDPLIKLLDQYVIYKKEAKYIIYLKPS